MKPYAKLPKNVPHISDNDLDALAKTPQCQRILDGTCSSPCSPVRDDGTYDVEVDHIVPRAEGGGDMLNNLQLLCASANRRKYTKPDPNYSDTFWWDSPFNENNLRHHQKMKAFYLVKNQYRHLFAEPSSILSRVLLLAWMVGAGKTIGVVSAIFAYNQVRNAQHVGARRAKRVLWMVHQDALVQSVYHELRNEPYEFGLVDSKPHVEKVENYRQWDYKADIIVACPQALWPAENRTLSDEKRREILAGFDVIVIDEAQFGVERYLEILRDAPHALKFAITATPMDASGKLLCETEGGKYANQFALLSCFSYDDGRAQGIFKSLPRYNDGLGEFYHPVHGGQSDVRRGELIQQDNDTQQEHNVIRANAVIAKAINQAEAETRVAGYDCHLMLRVNSKTRADQFGRILQDGADQSLGTSVVYSGKPGPQLGDNKHPWMLVKGNNGRAKPQSTRIVLTVDIGQFGINNRYCGVIAWIDTVSSLVEIVQRIGRAIRSREGKGSVRLVWNGRDSSFSEKVKEAIDYMRNMHEQLEMFDTLDQVGNGELSADIPPAKHRLPSEDQMILASLSGNDETASPDELVDRWEARRGQTLTEKQRERGRDWIEGINTEPERKNQILWLPGSLEFRGAAIVEREEAPDEYPLETLLSYLESGKVFEANDMIEEFQAVLRDPDNASHDHYRRIVNDLVRKNERQIYRTPNIDTPAHIVVAGSKKQCEQYGVYSYARELFNDFRQSLRDEVDANTLFQVCARKSNVAASYVFGLSNFQKASYQQFEPQLVEALSHIRTRKAIMGIAKPLIISELNREFDGDHVEGLWRFFRNQIDDVEAALFNKEVDAA